MKFFTIIFIFFILLNTNFAQRDLNLDFEIIARDGNYPVEWKSTGSHVAYLDEKIKKKGKNAVRLQLSPDASISDNSFYFQNLILDNKIGKEIVLRGYIKTENIGSAGFFIHSKSGSFFEGNTIFFDKMDGRIISGTADWTPIILRIPFSKDLYQIEFGAYLEGKGKVWIDDLKLMIDGKPYQLAPEKNTINNTQKENSKDNKKKN